MIFATGERADMSNSRLKLISNVILSIGCRRLIMMDTIAFISVIIYVSTPLCDLPQFEYANYSFDRPVTF